MSRRASKKEKPLQPLRLANALLELLYNTYEVEEIQGDLFELFERRVSQYGLRQARRLYWLDVFRFLAPFSRKRKIKPLYAPYLCPCCTTMYSPACETPRETNSFQRST